MSYCQARISSGSCVSSASISPCGIEKRLWLKSTFFASSSYSNIGKSTIQQNLKQPCSIKSELLAHPGARGAGQLGGVRFLAGGEEQAVVGPEAEFGVDLFHVLGAVVLGDRAAELAALAGDVAEPGKGLRRGPVVHVVEELAALLGRARRGDRADHPALAHDLLEQAEARLP